MEGWREAGREKWREGGIILAFPFSNLSLFKCIISKQNALRQQICFTCDKKTVEQVVVFLPSHPWNGNTSAARALIFDRTCIGAYSEADSSPRGHVFVSELENGS